MIKQWFNTNTFFIQTLILSLSLGLFCSCQLSEEEYHIWIKNAKIIDGTGTEAYYAHLLILDDLIRKIEKDTSKSFKAQKLIEADGKVLSPGFIDTHAHGDPFKHPALKNFLSMGVTSIFLGQDGFSPNEKDIATWMDRMDSLKPGTNIGLFVGHGTLRKLSGVNYDRPTSESGLRSMEALLEEALKKGCFGLSTGLEYNPGYLADDTELIRLAKICGKHGGMIMSHMRNEDDGFLEESIEELLLQAPYCPVHISHIKSVYGRGAQRAQAIWDFLDSKREEGLEITADVYPYTASYTSISLLFPDWALAPNDYRTVKRKRGQELRAYLKDRVNYRNGPDATLIGSGPYKGKTLAELEKELRKPFQDILVDDIGPDGASAAYFIMNDELQDFFVTHPDVMICSDGSPEGNHPRGHGTFARIIERYVVNEAKLSLELAIYKMTALPAKTLGMADRGQVREGWKADLLIFDPEQIRETASYAAPFRLAKGFEYILLNGELVKEGESISSQRAGLMLRKASGS